VTDKRPHQQRRQETCAGLMWARAMGVPSGPNEGSEAQVGFLPFFFSLFLFSPFPNLDFKFESIFYGKFKLRLIFYDNIN
jgi:hypothetical protein